MATKKKVPAKIVAEVTDAKVLRLDPRNVKAKLYDLVADHCDRIKREGEDIDIRAVTMALGAIARIIPLWFPKGIEPENVGSAARKYQATFQANAARRGKVVAGSTLKFAPRTTDADDEPDWDDDFEDDEPEPAA